jgi:hypothetical protein
VESHSIAKNAIEWGTQRFVWATRLEYSTLEDFDRVVGMLKGK